MVDPKMAEKLTAKEETRLYCRQLSKNCFSCKLVHMGRTKPREGKLEKD
jgi:hypothetical protein